LIEEDKKMTTNQEITLLKNWLIKQEPCDKTIELARSKIKQADFDIDLEELLDKWEKVFEENSKFVKHHHTAHTSETICGMYFASKKVTTCIHTITVGDDTDLEWTCYLKKRKSLEQAVNYLIRYVVFLDKHVGKDSIGRVWNDEKSKNVRFKGYPSSLYKLLIDLTKKSLRRKKPANIEYFYLDRFCNNKLVLDGLNNKVLDCTYDNNKFFYKRNKADINLLLKIIGKRVNEPILEKKLRKFYETIRKMNTYKEVLFSKEIRALYEKFSKDAFREEVYTLLNNNNFRFYDVYERCLQEDRIDVLAELVPRYEHYCFPIDSLLYCFSHVYEKKDLKRARNFYSLIIYKKEKEYQYKKQAIDDLFQGIKNTISKNDKGFAIQLYEKIIYDLPIEKIDQIVDFFKHTIPDKSLYKPIFEILCTSIGHVHWEIDEYLSLFDQYICCFNKKQIKNIKDVFKKRCEDFRNNWNSSGAKSFSSDKLIKHHELSKKYEIKLSKDYYKDLFYCYDKEYELSTIHASNQRNLEKRKQKLEDIKRVLDEIKDKYSSLVKYSKPIFKNAEQDIDKRENEVRIKKIFS